MSPRELRPAPAARQVDTALIVRWGVGAFAVALVIFIALPWSRDNPDNRIWLWSALAGVVLGTLGLLLMRWQGAPGATSDRPRHAR